MTVKVVFAPPKLRLPRASIWWAPADALGIVILVLKAPVADVFTRPRVGPPSQNSETVSPA